MFQDTVGPIKSLRIPYGIPMTSEIRCCDGQGLAEALGGGRSGGAHSAKRVAPSGATAGRQGARAPGKRVTREL